LAAAIGFNTFLVYLILPFVFAFITLLLCVRFILKKPVLSIFTMRTKLDFKRVLVGFGAWGILLAVFLLIGIYSSDKLSWNFNPETFFPLMIIALVLIPIQTTCEEVLFRGYLFQLIGARFKQGIFPVIFTGILFGLVHGSNPEVAKIGNILLLYYISTGLFFGMIALMDDGLELSMGYHAANNIFAALIVTNDWQAFTTDALFIDHSAPAFGLDSWLTILVLQPLLLLIFAKIYKWKNWKVRLLSEDSSMNIED
jgi:membrane protease YdiL (CAAX protease family)